MKRLVGALIFTFTVTLPGWALAAAYGSGAYGRCGYNEGGCDSAGQPLASTGEGIWLAVIAILVALILTGLALRRRRKRLRAKEAGPPED